MAQHDYMIADQTGASFLTDLNNVLSAIISNNSGATEPSTKYAYQFWCDTTTGLLKQRNAANSAWVTIGTMASANLGLALVAGSASQSFSALNLSAAGTLAVTGIATFTAPPVGPTQAASDDSTKLATTAHVLDRLQRAPSFSAANASQQSLTTGTPAKITLGTETHDTGGYFASSRFTPLVPGYYKISYRVGLLGTSVTSAYAMLYYNGAEVDRGAQIAIPSGAGMTEFHSSGSFFIFMNGSTDFLELYAAASGTVLVADYSRFSGALARPF